MHGRKVEAIIGAVLLLAVVAGAAVAQSFSQVVNLGRGQTAYVSCDGAARLRAERQSELIMLLSCGRAEQAPPTATATPAQPPAPTATATAQPPSGDLLPVEPVSMLGTCPAAVHDQFVTTGPDGRLWRTWHAQVVALPGGGSCRFAHEHGDDPRTSNADGSLPAFGYIGSLVGLNEPHEGFKVYVVNRGVRNDEGRTAQVDSRIVVHMSTARPLPGMAGGRFTMPFHSLEYDMVSPTGHEVHVMGMANTFAAGSICERDARSQSADPVGRVLYIDPRENSCAANSTYEIWGLQLDTGAANVHVAAAAFDTGTGLTPSTGVAFATGLLGCDREAYHGPVYWYNQNGPVEFRTDAYGRPDANGPLVQFVSRHSAIGIPFSNDQGQFKLRPASYCAPGLALPN